MSYRVEVAVYDEDTGEEVFAEVTSTDDPVAGLRYMSDDLGGELAKRDGGD